MLGCARSISTLEKTPSISETIDWTRALVVLAADRLDEELVESTLDLLLEYQGDIDTALARIPALLSALA